MLDRACHHVAYFQHKSDPIIRMLAGDVNVLLRLVRGQWGGRLATEFRLYRELPRIPPAAMGLRRNLCSCVDAYAEEITQMMFSDSVQGAGQG